MEISYDLSLRTQLPPEQPEDIFGSSWDYLIEIESLVSLESRFKATLNDPDFTLSNPQHQRSLFDYCITSLSLHGININTNILKSSTDSEEGPLTAVTNEIQFRKTLHTFLENIPQFSTIFKHLKFYTEEQLLLTLKHTLSIVFTQETQNQYRTFAACLLALESIEIFTPLSTPFIDGNDSKIPDAILKQIQENLLPIIQNTTSVDHWQSTFKLPIILLDIIFKNTPELNLIHQKIDNYVTQKLDSLTASIPPSLDNSSESYTAVEIIPQLLHFLKNTLFIHNPYEFPAFQTLIVKLLDCIQSFPFLTSRPAPTLTAFIEKLLDDNERPNLTFFTLPNFSQSLPPSLRVSLIGYLLHLAPYDNTDAPVFIPDQFFYITYTNYDILLKHLTINFNKREEDPILCHPTLYADFFFQNIERLTYTKCVHPKNLTTLHKKIQKNLSCTIDPFSFLSKLNEKNQQIDQVHQKFSNLIHITLLSIKISFYWIARDDDPNIQISGLTLLNNCLTTLHDLEIKSPEQFSTTPIRQTLTEYLPQLRATLLNFLHLLNSPALNQNTWHSDPNQNLPLFKLSLSMLQTNVDPYHALPILKYFLTDPTNFRQFHKKFQLHFRLFLTSIKYQSPQNPPWLPDFTQIILKVLNIPLLAHNYYYPELLAAKYHLLASCAQNTNTIQSNLDFFHPTLQIISTILLNNTYSNHLSIENCEFEVKALLSALIEIIQETPDPTKKIELAQQLFLSIPTPYRYLLTDNQRQFLAYLIAPSPSQPDTPNKKN